MSPAAISQWPPDHVAAAIAASDTAWPEFLDVSSSSNIHSKPVPVKWSISSFLFDILSRKLPLAHRDSLTKKGPCIDPRKDRHTPDYIIAKATIGIK
jgi:hypothetical protein